MFVNLSNGKLSIEDHRNPAAIITEQDDLLFACKQKTGETLTATIKNLNRVAEAIGKLEAL